MSELLLPEPFRPVRIALEGGSFLMGSDAHYPEERPVRSVRLAAFCLESLPVRNLEFSLFVRETGYRTFAERQGHSHVFSMTAGPVPLGNPDAWWKAVPGACWRDPRPGEPLPDDFDMHPVVHVTLNDALAYTAWCGGRLPTEAEWEFAARGGLLQAEFAWGDEFAPAGQRMAHVWRGAFPWYYAPGGTPATLPAGQFPPNGYGLFDMTGNVWEWTHSSFRQTVTCCACSPESRADKNSDINPDALFTLKGGSHLCAAEYCLRYRPAARIGLAAGSSTSHIGFRCAYNLS